MSENAHWLDLSLAARIVPLVVERFTAAIWENISEQRAPLVLVGSVS
jgi:hypothetical protein